MSAQFNQQLGPHHNLATIPQKSTSFRGTNESLGVQVLCRNVFSDKDHALPLVGSDIVKLHP
jgi:hypothetical protein